jgi:hypothetical protein
MIGPALKTLKTYFTAVGAALPQVLGLKHGQLNIKQASVTEDEAYLVLRDAAGALQYRRLVTTTLGGTLYVEVAGDTMTGPLILDMDSTGAFIARKADDTNLFVVDTTNGRVEVRNSGTLRVYSGDGTGLNFVVSGATGIVTLNNGADLNVFSDASVTRVCQIDGATGNIDLEGQLIIGAGAAEIIQGTGSPEGVHSAPVGSLFLRTDGGTDTAVYKKETGTGNTGWIAIAAGGASALTVQEGGVTVDATVNLINFDASDFNVTEPVEDQIAVALAYGTGAGTPAEGNHLHDSTYVNVTGDTMTGPLVVDTDTTPALHVLSDAASPFIVEDADGTNRVVFNGASNEFSFQNGVDFVIYSDTATTVKLAVDGATGDIDTEGQITLGATAAELIAGAGTPEAAANATVSSLFHRTDAATPNTELYVKQAGTGTDTTGWVPVNQGIQVTVGPFYINDLPGTATTQATLGYFNTATAVSRDATDPHLRTAGRIVGLIVVSDVARTAGTATGRVRIAGADTAFNGGAVLLDATNTEQDASFVNHASGVAFTNAQTIGVNITTSGWTPITANITAWLVVSLDPFV